MTVEKGYFDLNGNLYRCTGDVTINEGGLLEVDAGARLEVGSGRALTVNTGAVLSVIGSTTSPALVTHHAGNFEVNIENGGAIRAANAVFEYPARYGINVKAGATIDPEYPFTDCAFARGALGATYLTLNNDQTLTIMGAQFPHDPGGAGPANVRKEVKQGHLSFVNSAGEFAGEKYDYDPYNLIDWHSGALTSVAIRGPSVATRGGEYSFSALLMGDLPLTPIQFVWEATDHVPVTHTLSALADEAQFDWDAAGSHSIVLTASNVLGKVNAKHTLTIADLQLTNLMAHHAGATNWCTLTLTGTSSNSSYALEWTTNLVEGVWRLASPLGENVAGQDWETDWTDWGETNRNLNALSNLYYRAVLK